MHVKHAVLLKVKHAALFLIMLLVLGLIMLRVDLARVRLRLIISLPPKKTAPVFLTQLVCIIFLSAFGDIMQIENNGSNYMSPIHSHWTLTGNHDNNKYGQSGQRQRTGKWTALLNLALQQGDHEKTQDEQAGQWQ